MQLLLFLALGPMVYIVFRIYLAAAKVIFNFLVLMVFAVILIGISIFDKPKPSSSWTPQTYIAAPEQTQAAPCADVEQLLASGFGPGELCDRYYKSQQCQSEIEAAFVQAKLQLSPLAVCGAALPPPAPATPLPESFNSKATTFLDKTPLTSRAALFENLHESELPAKSSLALDEVRNTSKLPAFLAFAKPSGDALAIEKLAGGALAGHKLARKATGGSVVLEDVPMFTPFAGIVRGIYQRTPLQECTVRVRDHSLCIEHDGQIKCNVFAQVTEDTEQVCVDYLIR